MRAKAWSKRLDAISTRRMDEEPIVVRFLRVVSPFDDTAEQERMFPLAEQAVMDELSVTGRPPRCMFSSWLEATGQVRVEANRTRWLVTIEGEVTRIVERQEQPWSA